MTHQDSSSSDEAFSGIEEWEIEHPDREFDIVLIPDEGVLGVVLSRGAYASTVFFIKDGHTYQVIYENDELEPM